jgi:hypothetical protein
MKTLPTILILSILIFAHQSAISQTLSGPVRVSLGDSVKISPAQALALASFDDSFGFVLARAKDGASAYGHLPIVGKPEVARMMIANSKTGVTAVFGRSKAGLDYPDRLWIDWKDEKKLDPKGLIQGRTVRGGSVFGPISLDGATNSVDPFYIVNRTQLGHEAAPAAIRTGRLQLGGKSILVGLARYPQHQNPCLLIDYNGDGVFSGRFEFEGAAQLNEVVQIRGPVQMPDGELYHVRIGDDLASIDFEKDNRPKGRLQFTNSAVCLWLQSSDGMSIVHLSQDMAALPVGKYTVFSATVLEQDAHGEPWMALMAMAKGNDAIVIAADKITELRAGGTFLLNLDKRATYGDAIKVIYDTSAAHDIPPPDARGVMFGLGLKDKFGNRISGVRSPDGKLPPAPQLKITDSHRRLMAIERFQYG